MRMIRMKIIIIMRKTMKIIIMMRMIRIDIIMMIRMIRMNIRMVITPQEIVCLRVCESIMI